MEQVGKAVKIAKVKYPSLQGYHHVLTTAAATQHLLEMLPRQTKDLEENCRRCGTQSEMENHKLCLNLTDNQRELLEERGYNTKGMKLEEMRAILADHDDSKNDISEQLRALFRVLFSHVSSLIF